MTVKEIRSKIRQLTSAINETIREFRSKGKEDTFFNKAVSQLKAETAYVNYKTEEVRVPKSRTGGELGLGFKNKRKAELEKQLFELESFEKKEWFSTKAVKERSERAKKAYKTFTDRYGDISWDEWEDFIDIMNNTKNQLMDYGYEDMGGSIARSYSESSDKGKKQFKDYLMDNMQRAKGKGFTPEDFIDELTEVLIEEGVIDEW